MARNVVTLSLSMSPIIAQWLTEKAKENKMSRSELVQVIVETHKLRGELKLDGK